MSERGSEPLTPRERASESSTLSVKIGRRIGVAGTALVVAAVAMGAASATAGPGQVIGVFADASPLVVGSSVRAAGVDVGKIESIDLVDGRAQVVISVVPAVLPLHQDATLKIRPVNLLGEQYVELNAGSPSSPLMADPVVPESQVDSSVDIQEVLDGLGDPTATALAGLVSTLGQGVQDSGGEAAAALRALQPALAETDKLAGLLDDQNVVLRELVDRVHPVAGALATDNGATLDRLVGSTEQTLSTMAANRQAVDETLAELPATLVSAQRALRQLAGVSEEAVPTLAAIRPVTDDLTELAEELERFADVADPALSSLPAVLEKGCSTRRRR